MKSRRAPGGRPALQKIKGSKKLGLVDEANGDWRRGAGMKRDFSLQKVLGEEAVSLRSK
jgi:hypothetical protein